MSALLDTVPSTIVRFINNPLANLFVGCLASYVSCLSLIWYYYPNKITPVLQASGFSEKLSSVPFLNACLVTVTICGLLLLDLSLDFWSSWDDYRSRQNERKKRALLMKPETTNGIMEQETEIDDYDFKEYFTRLMYIVCCLVASIMILAGRPDYRCILGYVASRFRNISMYTISMYSTVDAFGPRYKWICLFCSVVFASGATWAMYLRFQGAENNMSGPNVNISKLLAFVTQCVATIIACIIFLYLWSLMFLQARSAYKTREATLFSVKEWTFLIYSAASFCSITTVFLTSMSYNFQLDLSSLNDLLLRESVMIIAAIAWAILPSRVARTQAKMLRSRWMNAKRDVTSLLNSNLKLATSELNGLMDDENTEGHEHPHGYVSISRQRLARVASACNSTIIKLTSIAEEKEGDHLGDDDDSSMFCAFQDYGHTSSSDRNQLSSSNVSSSWGTTKGGGFHHQRFNLYHISDNGKMMREQGQHCDEQDEICYDDTNTMNGDANGEEKRMHMLHPRIHTPSRSHHDRRNGGDVSSQYDNTSQHSRSQISGGIVESLSLWSARFSNLSSISNTTIEGDVRTRLANRTATMLLGRRTKECMEDMIDIPTHPHDVEEGGERGDHNVGIIEIDKGIVMTNGDNDAATDGMMIVDDTPTVSRPVQQQQQQRQGV